MEPQVLIVMSAGAPSYAVVPVLVAIETAGQRAQAIYVGAAGACGAGVTDRVCRGLLGDGAERRLRKELEVSPLDAVVVFDPHAALALTVARDQVQNSAPVIAVNAHLEPATAWAQTDAGRFLAVDEMAAVGLVESGAPVQAQTRDRVQASAKPGAKKPVSTTADDEPAALKQKMASAPSRKKL